MLICNTNTYNLFYYAKLKLFINMQFQMYSIYSCLKNNHIPSCVDELRVLCVLLCMFSNK